MKYTLLELTQEILSNLDSDDVASITENDEATQVAHIVRACYFDILTRSNLPELYSLYKLEETSASSPTLMSLPTDQDTLDWVKYNKIQFGETAAHWADIPFKSRDLFFRDMYELNSDNDNVDSYNITIGSNSIQILYEDDRGPTCFTTYNDSNIIFNSVDTAVEAYLRKTKTLCYGKAIIPFTMSDGFTPTLDDNQFQLLLNESKAQAFAELKQTTHAIAEKKAKQAWSGIGKRKHNIKDASAFDQLMYFGRK